MPFKSEAQRRKFKEMLAQGKITQKIYDAMEEATPSKLPARLSTPGKSRKPSAPDPGPSYTKKRFSR